jgi:hypothetical protein
VVFIFTESFRYDLEKNTNSIALQAGNKIGNFISRTFHQARGKLKGYEQATDFQT